MFVSRSMTRRVITVDTATKIFDAQELMAKNHIRHLPVFRGEQIIGVISIGDVVKAIISQQEFVIEQLENYIAGR